ncbi:MAG: DUF1553 domain-containing protein [Planctomycetes bacterium]|nr:DUF1553 domain-containing protein [Planctomycetota bacterium]
MPNHRPPQDPVKVFGFSTLAGLLAALALLGEPATPSARVVPPADQSPPASTSGGLDSLALAARIDRYLEASWEAEKVEPAPPAQDAEFLRRLYLDLAGKIPPVSAAREFLDNRDPEKRRQLVDRLLDSPAYATHLANTLRNLMLPGANANLQFQSLIPLFEAWLRLRLADDVRYDKLVGELLTVTTRDNVPFNPAAGGEPSPAAFFVANELKPENLAASTSRIFLGVQVQCAQCHNHPFARWKREQFWQLAAFFGGGNAGSPQARFGAGLQDNTDRKGIEIPGTGTIVPARFLDGSEPAWEAGAGKRATLARWVTSADNPYFARAIVNRLWYHFFGRGLVDPVDDIDEANPPSHPEILDELARQLVYHDFDLKYLIRAITATRAYQLSSLTTHASQEEPRRFARMSLRSMTGEQLFESLVQATGFPEQAPNQRNVFVVGANMGRAAFMNKFSDTGPSPTDHQASILQALTLMNGQLIADATSLNRGETVQAVLEAPFLDTGKRIEILYLATLTRRPTNDEAAKLNELVQKADTETKQKQALADVFWALLNSTEFALNH